MIFAAITSSHFYVFQHYQQSEAFTSVLNYMNLLFTILFAVEMLIKVVAYTPRVRCYFENCFAMLSLHCQLDRPIVLYLSIASFFLAWRVLLPHDTSRNKKPYLFRATIQQEVF